MDTLQNVLRKIELVNPNESNETLMPNGGRVFIIFDTYLSIPGIFYIVIYKIYKNINNSEKLNK